MKTKSNHIGKKTSSELQINEKSAIPISWHHFCEEQILVLIKTTRISAKQTEPVVQAAPKRYTHGDAALRHQLHFYWQHTEKLTQLGTVPVGCKTDCKSSAGANDSEKTMIYNFVIATNINDD